MADAGAAANRVTITGVVVRVPRQRTNPAGVPITTFALDHASRQREAGFEREARCRLGIVAAGDALRDRLAGVEAGTEVTVTGFLSRANNREGLYRLVLHAEDVERT